MKLYNIKNCNKSMQPKFCPKEVQENQALLGNCSVHLYHMNKIRAFEEYDWKQTEQIPLKKQSIAITH